MSTENIYDQYINNLTEIRALSNPSLDDIEDADAYRDMLRENFIRIGMIAAENRKFLDEDLFPVLNSDEPLSKEQIEALEDFCDKLFSASELVNLDTAIIDMVTDRLLEDAVDKGDFEAQIRYMDLNISVAYALMNMTGRITAYPEISKGYRLKGFKMGDFFSSLLSIDRLSSIEDQECRELVLINSRFLCVFFENYIDPENNGKDLSLLEECLLVCDNPSYHELVPDFDWGYQRFRLLEYYASSTDYNNTRGFDKDQLETIYQRTKELWNLWHSEPEYYAEFEDERYLKIMLTRNRFLAGRITKAQYLQELKEIFDNRIADNFDMCGIAENILLPTEIMCLFEGKTLTDDEKAIINDLVPKVIDYIFQMSNSGILSYSLEYTSKFIEHFVEVPDGIHFDDLLLDMLAAMHPPTYVHSMMDASLSACLCSHLIELHPELFLGIFDYNTIDDVRENQEMLIQFAYNAALCHDAGKLFIIDVVFVYGRKLQDMEFDLIKTHPTMGAALLSKYPSTKDYAEIALGHHIWYDNSRGYPEEFDTSKSPLKTIIDIVLCADCLDAATDTIGRSYNRGKTIDDFVEELKEGTGTRYAPWLIELFSKEMVRADLEYLLTEGREQNYRGTYDLLKSVHDKIRQ